MESKRYPVREIKNIGRSNSGSSTRDIAHFDPDIKAKRLSLKQRVMKDISQYGPSNSRVIAKRLREERTSINKALRELEKAKKIYKAFDQRCSITNRLTHQYAIVSDEPQQTELFV